ncbi:MAG: hypothetical protein IJJ80_09650 [Clostridia bacterium]|nr:hypothetical protein [Clostridia bacterium]
MKYGESTFDILYLVLVILWGCQILKKARNKTERLMGTSALVLGIGDAFHLVPRVLNYFIEADFSAALGIGKLVTSITMTLFYVLVYYIWIGYYKKTEDKRLTCFVWALTALRVIICLFPQNGWLTNEGGVLWGILRNIPFTALGCLVVALYYGTRNETKHFRFVWLYITLSFLFYLPVAVGASLVPMLGMLMLPKTVCYLLLVWTFRAATNDEPRGV